LFRAIFIVRSFIARKLGIPLKWFVTYDKDNHFIAVKSVAGRKEALELIGDLAVASYEKRGIIKRVP